MFYFVEQLKGTPKEKIKGLLFGTCNIYDYYIIGCETISENISGYYQLKNCQNWKNSNRKNNPESFIKQFKTINKREGFTLNSKNLIHFN